MPAGGRNYTTGSPGAPSTVRRGPPPIGQEKGPGVAPGPGSGLSGSDRADQSIFLSSTRRFWVRPAAVLLSATGCVEPYPFALSREGAIPLATR